MDLLSSSASGSEHSSWSRPRARIIAFASSSPVTGATAIIIANAVCTPVTVWRSLPALAY